MPNWKKLIVSGSDAALNSLNVTTAVSASSLTGSFLGDVSNITGLVSSPVISLKNTVENDITTSGGTPSGSFLDTFSAGFLDSQLWYNNTNNVSQNATIVYDALRLTNDSNAWDYSVVGKKSFLRSNNPVFVYDFKILDTTYTSEAPRFMIGVTDIPTGSSYADNVHALYFRTSGAQIIEAYERTSRQNPTPLASDAFSVGDTFRAILEPQTSGFDYTIYKNGDFNSPFASGSRGSRTEGTLYPAIYIHNSNPNVEFYSVYAYDSTSAYNYNVEQGISFVQESHAVSTGEIVINSGSSVDVNGTWDVVDSYFFTQNSNKQIYGLLFDFDGAIALSTLVGQNLWKNNSSAERWYNNAYQWDPNEVDSSHRGRVKIKVGLTYEKDAGNAYVRLTDVRDGVKTYLGSDWYQLTTADPSSVVFTEFEFEGVDGAGTPFTPGGIDRYLALESFTESGIFLGLYKADVKLTPY